MLPVDPSAGEWATAIVAAGLIVVLGGLHLLRPALRHAPPGPWARLAGLALAAVTAGVLLCVVVVCGAGIRAAGVDLGALGAGGDGDAGYPQGPFAGVLVDADPDVTEHVGRYATAMLLPLAAVFGVLALAVVGTGRRSGLRIAAVVAAVALAALAVVLVGTDPGAVVAGAAWVALGLAVVAVVAIALDELGYPRSRSSPSTSRSQRSLQSAQR